MLGPLEWKGLPAGQRLRPSLRDDSGDQRAGWDTLTTLSLRTWQCINSGNSDDPGVFTVTASPVKSGKLISRKWRRGVAIMHV